MSRLDSQTYNEIVNFLIPHCVENNARRSWIESALFGCPVLEHIEWSGAVRPFTIQLVRTLLQYGQCEANQPAIMMLLKQLKQQVGVKQQEQIDALLARIPDDEIETTQDDWQVVGSSSGKHVFIAYSHHNLEIVRRFTTDLLNAGIDIWVDHMGLQGGTPDWDKAIRKAIEEADAMLYMASPDALESTHVKDEISLAKRFKTMIYPLWIDGDEWMDSVPIGFGYMQYIDLRGKSYEQNLSRIIGLFKDISTVNTLSQDVSELGDDGVEDSQVEPTNAASQDASKLNDNELEEQVQTTDTDSQDASELSDEGVEEQVETTDAASQDTSELSDDEVEEQVQTTDVDAQDASELSDDEEDNQIETTDADSHDASELSDYEEDSQIEPTDTASQDASELSKDEVDEQDETTDTASQNPPESGDDGETKTTDEDGVIVALGSVLLIVAIIIVLILSEGTGGPNNSMVSDPFALTASVVVRNATETARATRFTPFELTATAMIRDATETARATQLSGSIDSLELTATAIIRNATQTAHAPAIAAIQYASSVMSRNSEWQILYRNGFTQSFDEYDMVLVPVGCFKIGNDNGEDNERNGNVVCFEEPFWIDKYEVTNEQYGSTECEDWSSEPDQPRNCVDWFDAKAFCESRNARLPTEAEWEYAARGPDGLAYPWGNEWNPDYANWVGILPDKTVTVGELPNGASWVGAMNMSGNVWEWTSSLYEGYPYDAEDGREREDDSIDVHRILRGGSFVNASNYLHSAYRLTVFPNLENFDFGFRCARSLDR